MASLTPNAVELALGQHGAITTKQLERDGVARIRATVPELGLLQPAVKSGLVLCAARGRPWSNDVRCCAWPTRRCS